MLGSVTRYGFILRTSARQQWVYRAEMVTRAGQMVLFVCVFMALWSSVYAITGQTEMAGYTRAQVIWYFAMTETIVLSSSRIFIEISEAVRAGDVAYTLTRPLSYPLYQAANSLGNAAPRFLLNLLTAAVVLGLGMGHVAGTLAGLAAFLLMAALALLLDTLVAVLIGLLAFWLEEVMPIFWIYQKLLFTIGGMFLPLEMFPEWLRRLAAWLPFQFTIYAPARAFVDFDLGFVLRSVAGQAAYIAIVLALVLAVWRRARRR